jgi:hypothetical protein
VIRKFSSLLLSGGLALSFVSCQTEKGATLERVDAAATTGQISAYQGVTFEKTLEAAKEKIGAQMTEPLKIPVPKDAGGGYTHERHKDNAKLIYDAGQIYKITGDKAYADFAAKLMAGYADVYPDWGLHPEQKEQSPGRMFWQNLNESWWLVHTAQSYEAIKSTLSDDQKNHIETNLLRNLANFLSVEAPETFDKIHNHGTWATAAVGLTGYAIGDEDYVEQALLGLDKSGEAGFLKQMDVLFSPDGYYNEGPYYQRYALMPFVVFAHAVNKNNPEKRIFEQRDGILKKAIFTTIQQSYGGLFFPINDAIKDKDIATTELLHGVAIAYDLTGDKGLLSIAEAQGKFVLTPESRQVSNDLVAGKAKPFDFKSMRLSDGADGTQGALDILRASSNPNDLTVVAKNTSQGLGHGHFDKLALLVFDQGHEIIRDYGAARFLNVEAKYGGHYLPENNAYAKQTIAHNALVVDELSHFDGDTALGNKHAPTLGTFVGEGSLKITSAEIDTAYDGVKLRRTVAIIEDKAFPMPVVADIMRAESEAAHQYDLPFHYNGQVTDTNFTLQADPVSRTPLGTKNGYQYLWKVAESRAVDGLSQFTFLQDRRFYTVTSAVPENTSVLIAETGANDPNINLRREPAFILRSWADKGVTFASVIEPHGEYNPTVEYTQNSHSHIKAVSHFEDGENSFIQIETKAGDLVGLGLSSAVDETREHSMTIDGQTKTWQGPYKVFHSTASQETEE